MMVDQGQHALSDEARLWFQAGLAACDLQDYERAIAHFDQVLQIETGCWQVWYERGLVLELLGQYEAAIASHQTALSLNPPDQAAVEIWYHQGDVLHYGLGQYQQAVRAYDQVLQRDPYHASAWLHRGNAQLYGLQSAHEALISYDRALHLDPDCELIWRNRGNALSELGLYHAAIINYDRAITLNPHDSGIWQAKTSVLEKIGDVTGAGEASSIGYGRQYWDAQSALPTTPQEDIDGNEPPINVSTLIQTFHRTAETTTAVMEAPTTYSRSGLQAPLVAPATQLIPSLVIYDTQGRRQLRLVESHYSIGRDSSNDIQLYSKFASRRHAVLVEVPSPASARTGSPQIKIYKIQDGDGHGQRSTNGLVINGRKCRDWTLRHGDTVLFGPKVWLQYLLLTDDTL